MMTQNGKYQSLGSKWREENCGWPFASLWSKVGKKEEYGCIKLKNHVICYSCTSQLSKVVSCCFWKPICIGQKSSSVYYIVYDLSQLICWDICPYKTMVKLHTRTCSFLLQQCSEITLPKSQRFVTPDNYIIQIPFTKFTIPFLSCL